MTRSLLTDSLVASLEATGRLYRVFDTLDRALCIRVAPGGGRAWYRREGAKWVPLGSWPAVSVADARRTVTHSSVTRGEPKAEALSLYAIARRFRKDHFPKLKESTRVDYERYLGAWERELGSEPVYRISRRQVIESLPRTTGGSGTARNRSLEVLSKLFSYCMDLEIVESNPCFRIKHEPETRRDRFLTGIQLKNIWKWAGKQGVHGHLLRFLLASGLRLGEALGISGDKIDFKSGLVYLSDTKTGSRSVNLGEMALGELKIIIGLGGMPGYWGVQSWWRRAKSAGHVPGWLRIHDLRHAFASVAIQSGIPLAEIGALLGHAPGSKMTSRYSHLGSTKKASEKASEALRDAVRG